MAARLPDSSFFRPRLAPVRAQLDDAEGRRGTLAVLGITAVFAIGVLALAWWAIRTPSGRDLRNARFAEASIVYAATGEELARYHHENRTWVEIDAISPHVKDALIATEDHRFYTHRGVDLRRTVSSAFKTVGGSRQGGSTITMQLARNAFPEIKDDPALIRKYKEWVTAIRLEDKFEKDEILEMYLNSVPFLYGAWGIEAAARTYFQKSAGELDVDEAAVLVGMLKGTAYYNPRRNPGRAHERRNVVLEQMVTHGYLDASTFESLKTDSTELDFRRMTHEDNEAPHFVEFLREHLDEWTEENGYNLYTDGLRIHTTIDYGLQEAATNALEQVGGALHNVAAVEWSRRSPPYFSSNMNAYADYAGRVDGFGYFWQQHGGLLDRFIRQSAAYQSLTKEQGVGADSALARLRGDAAFVDSVKQAWQRLDASFLAVNPQNGHVKAWVGGRDFRTDRFDHVAQARRQPGSTFKPFVYAAALDQGFTPTTLVRDEVVEYVDPDTRRRWRPQNVGSASGQLITLRDALAYSKNTVTAQLMMELGPARVAEFARKMGIKSDLRAVPSLGLGTSEVSLLELVGAYTPLANQGVYREPVYVTRIENRHGRVLATFESDRRNALSAHTAFSTLDMMRDVVDRGTGVRIRHQYGARGELAGKTGTTQDGADGWFMLIHPELVMGSWVGFNTPSLSFRSDYWGQGAHNALHIVGDFYRNASLPDARFVAPPGWQRAEAPDTTRLAGLELPGNARFFDIDSLNARIDSLLSRGEGYFDRLDTARFDDPELDWRGEEITPGRQRGQTRADSLRRARADAPGRGGESTLDDGVRDSDEVDRVRERLRDRNARGRGNQGQGGERGRSDEAPGRQQPPQGEARGQGNPPPQGEQPGQPPRGDAPPAENDPPANDPDADPPAQDPPAPQPPTPQPPAQEPPADGGDGGGAPDVR